MSFRCSLVFSSFLFEVWLGYGSKMGVGEVIGVGSARHERPRKKNVMYKKPS